MAVARAAFKELSSEAILDNVETISGYLRQQLSGLRDAYPDMIEDIRGRGLLVGIKVKPNNREIMALARDQHLLIAGGSDNCVRMLPPLNITIDHAREAVARLEKTFLAAREKAKLSA
jgi:acetylornithine/N-succinyldiaminopimelate aminotransferase